MGWPTVVSIASSSSDVVADEYNKRLGGLGITKEQAEHYGLRAMTYMETVDALGYCKGVGSIEIPYYDVHGNETDFKRYRFLGYRGAAKYIQNTGGTAVYFQAGKNWHEALANTAIPLIITEGEFKAIAANSALSREGVCLALGGVYSFTTNTARAGGSVLIPDIARIQLRDREVFICFDYDGSGDGQPKPEVRRAELILASLLSSKGAKVYFARLADMRQPYSKMGLDDYLTANGGCNTPAAEAAMKGLLADSRKRIDTEASGPLYRMLSEWYEYRGQAVNVNTGLLLTFDKLKNATANQFTQEGPAFRQWTTSKWRGSVSKIDFLPEHDDQLVSGEVIGESGLVLNTWRGWRSVPAGREYGAEIGPWLEFKRALFSKEPHMEHEFDLFFAMLFQRPWVKQFRLPIVKSHLQGVGKSFLLETIAHTMCGGRDGLFKSYAPAKILGPNDLDDQWTDWVEGCVFAVFNEPGELGARHTNTIKDLVTGESLRVNAKYGLKYMVRNRVHCAITTNMDYTHRIGLDSRREMVVEPPADMRSHDWNGLVAWRDELGGLGAIMAYYLGYELGEYTGREPAPHSEAKAEMATASLMGWDAYIDAELIDVPFISLGREWERASEMGMRGSKQSLGAALRRWGYTIGGASKGQLNLAGYRLGKEVVYGLGEWYGHATNTQIADCLYERYFGGSKL